MFKQWVSVDRSTLETYSTSTDELVDMFCEKLSRPHCFIASQQAEFYKDRRNARHCWLFRLFICSTGRSWNNSQATVHHFVGYYMDSLGNWSLNARYISFRLLKTSRFWTCTRFSPCRMETKSFFPGIARSTYVIRFIETLDKINWL